MAYDDTPEILLRIEQLLEQILEQLTPKVKVEISDYTTEFDKNKEMPET